ncbi:MAG: arginase [Chloroherpetonaceae bacterium]|nr:arginase [Chloroherpetonaceae bacterium]MDW8437260.1 arginase [Chloroherpetonaceae bacterium]
MKVSIIGVPLDLGSDYQGANLGPAAMRIAGLQEKIEELGHEVTDLGDLCVPPRKNLSLGKPNAKFFDAIAKVASDLCARVEEALNAETFPVVVGGDHAMAIGTIAGVSRFFKRRGQKIGLIWIDAHADINTPDTSPSGNIHGMPLATVLGMGLPELVAVGENGAKLSPEHVHLIGIRSVDKGEKTLLKKLGVNFYTMTDIDKRGIQEIISKAVAHLVKSVDAIHISLDLDGLDPDIAPGVATPVKGGLDYRESHLIMETVAETGKLASMEIAENNPILDIRNRTAETAVELVQSALGKRIVD